MSIATDARAGAFGADPRSGAPELSDQQEPVLAAVIHSGRRPGPELRFATLPLDALRSLPVFAPLVRARARSQSYLERAARQWRERGGGPERLRLTIAALADELTKAGSVELAAAASRLALAATQSLLVGALELDHRLCGSARREPGAQAFITELDEQVAGLTSAYPPTTLERLDVQASRRAAREYFISAQVPLAIRRARKVARMSRIPLEDLTQTGIEGLIHAVDRFDPSYGVPFGAYGHAWIKSRVLRAEAQGGLIQLPTRLQRTRTDIRQAITRASTDGLATSTAMLAQRLQLPERVIVAVLQAEAPMLSLDGVTGTIIADTCADDASTADERIHAQERRRAVRRALASCAPRERAVLTQLFGVGCTPQPIGVVARRLGLTRQRVYQIRTQEIRRLRRPSIARDLVAYA